MSESVRARIAKRLLEKSHYYTGKICEGKCDLMLHLRLNETAPVRNGKLGKFIFQLNSSLKLFPSLWVNNFHFGYFCSV